MHKPTDTFEHQNSLANLVSELRCKLTSTDERALATLAHAVAIAFRPTSQARGGAKVARLDVADRYWIDSIASDGTASTIANCDDARWAIEAMTVIKAAYPHLSCWYHGQEARAEITGDLWLGLATILGKTRPGWRVVAWVADGTLSWLDPIVIKAVLDEVLIIAAIGRVRPRGMSSPMQT